MRMLSTAASVTDDPHSRNSSRCALHAILARRAMLLSVRADAPEKDRVVRARMLCAQSDRVIAAGNIDGERNRSGLTYFR